MMAIVAVTVFVVAYLLIATEWVSKTITALAGAGVILALGVATSEDAFYSAETGIDWDVIFLLLLPPSQEADDLEIMWEAFHITGWNGRWAAMDALLDAARDQNLNGLRERCGCGEHRFGKQLSGQRRG